MNPHPTGPSDDSSVLIPVRDYDLAATLTSGQAFRWRTPDGQRWQSVIHGRWVEVRWTPDGIAGRTAVSQSNWEWLTHYLQTGVDLGAVVRTFPPDASMMAAVGACRGLRLLRQDPWECLVSFICSSTKQIVQIQQIIDLLCDRFGEAVPVPPGEPAARAFPTPARLASATEAELRACKMGFRAPYVLAAARAANQGRLNLDIPGALPCSNARQILEELPGVGPKIANCVLLFAYGYQEAFPVDVWVMKALRQLYFPKRRPSPARLRIFVDTYFGPNAGYAQQYLFHYMRTGGTPANRHPAGHAPQTAESTDVLRSPQGLTGFARDSSGGRARRR